MRFLAWSSKCCTKEEGTLLQVATQEPQMRFLCGVWRAKKPPFMNTFGLLADAHRGGEKRGRGKSHFDGQFDLFLMVVAVPKVDSAIHSRWTIYIQKADFFFLGFIL